jgi:hypothetical protein
MRDCSDPDGQWARFLFVNQPLAAATLPDDDGRGIDLTGRLLDYYRAIDRLPAIEYRLSRQAFKRYQPVYNQLERLRTSHPNPGMRAVYSKMEGYIGRLALNLHVLHELSNGKTLPDEEIPLFIIERAIALAKFYIGQVKLIHASCAADLGEMSPHLAKIVEISKRMDATTGNSWIKAKVVQTGYDSRHRPPPDAIRSWFRELEALGIGSTRGAGIRVEYSWKSPDLMSDEPDPPPPPKVEKSGEKWITYPSAELTPEQSFTPKVEKVDNSKYRDTLLSSSRLPISVSSSSQSPIPNLPDALEISRSTSPLSSCDDAIASSQAVNTISTISSAVASVSTFQDCSEPDGTIPSNVFPQNQRQEPMDFTAPAGVKAGWKVVISTSAPPQNLSVSDSVSVAAPDSVSSFDSSLRVSEQAGRSPALLQATDRESSVSFDTSQCHQTEIRQNQPKAEGDSLKVGDRVNWENCPAHCERFAPFEIMSLDGDYAKLDLFEKPVRLAELHPI